MKRSPSLRGFTLIELLVVISIIAILASLAIPQISGALVRGQLVQAVNNARQIHLTTQVMANDSIQTSDPSFGWPGDSNTTSLTAFVKDQMITLGYLQEPDAVKIFSAGNKTAGTNSSTFSAANSAFNLYGVKDGDPSTAIYVTTKNYEAGGQNFVPNTDPFRDKGFVVFRKGGDGTFYTKAVFAGTNVSSKVDALGDVGTPTPRTKLGN